MTYLSVGIADAFITTPLNVYMVETLNAQPKMQSIIGILQTLPWSMKLFFGFLSDTCPINGMHRKPYLTIGSLLYSIPYMLYAMLGQHDVILLAACVFIAMLGLIQTDVMADTMCVERSRFESEEERGQMQATCYSIRFAGGIIGSVAGAFIYNRAQWGWGLTFFQIAFINGLLPFVMIMPGLLLLKEKYQKLKQESSTGKHAVHQTPHILEMGVLREHYNSMPPCAQPFIPSLFTLTEDTPQLQGLLTHHHHHASPPSPASRDPSVTPRSVSQRDPSPPLERSLSYGTHDSINPEVAARLTAHLASLGVTVELPATAVAPAPSPYPPTTINAATADGRSQQEREDDEEEVPSVTRKLNDIWMTVQLKAVWKPMAFVFVFNLFQVPNVAWQSYLQLSLNFEPWILGLTGVLGSFMTFVGVVAYKYYFFKSSWRSVYLWSSCLSTFFSLMQLCLIFQVNQKYFHLSNYLFSVGDDVVTAYLSGIQFMPLCIMYTRLCPEGAEGSAYSMLTTFGISAIILASSVGNAMSGIWDVSNEALKSHNVSGLWRLSLFTSALSLIPLTLLWLLPRSSEEQDSYSKSQKRSKVGGVIFLLVLFSSLGFSVWQALSELIEVWDAEHLQQQVSA